MAAQYNGLSHRIVKDINTSVPLDISLDQRTVMIYSAAWQLLEERVDDGWGGTGFTADDVYQTIYGIRYIDDVLCRRIDTNVDGDYTDASDKTYYHLTDNQFSTVAVIDDNANLIERIDYNPYGEARHHWKADVDGDGDHDTTDRNLINALTGSGGTPITSANYNVDCDLDRNGIINSTDYTLSSGSNAALTKGKLSTVGNVFGFSGYVYNAEPAIYTVRFRHYDVTMGRWLERDPLGYVDGMGLYEYVGGMPLRAVDPLGLAAEWHWHHIIPQHFWEKGGLLDGVDPTWKNNAINGTWLPKEVHYLTYPDEYTEFIRRKLKTLPKGKITKRQLQKIIDSIIADEQFKDVFKRAVSTKANYTARKSKKLERAKLSGLALASGLASLFFDQALSAIEVAGNSRAYGRLIKALEEGHAPDAERWADELYNELLASGSSHYAALSFKKWWDENSGELWRHYDEGRTGTIDSYNPAAYTSWDPTVPVGDVLEDIGQCLGH